MRIKVLGHVGLGRKYLGRSHGGELFRMIRASVDENLANKLGYIYKKSKSDNAAARRPEELPSAL